MHMEQGGRGERGEDGGDGLLCVGGERRREERGGGGVRAVREIGVGSRERTHTYKQVKKAQEEEDGRKEAHLQPREASDRFRSAGREDRRNEDTATEKSEPTGGVGGGR